MTMTKTEKKIRIRLGKRINYIKPDNSFLLAIYDFIMMLDMKLRSIHK